MSEQEKSLDQQQAELTAEYQRLSAIAGDADAKRQLSRLRAKLDELYWKKVEALVVGRVSAESESLNFSEDERLLIDVGMLDPALVFGAAGDLTQRLLDEIYSPGPANHLYFSEWIEDRYRRFRLAEEMKAQEQERLKEEQNSRLQQARASALRQLAPCFDSLPGVPPSLAATVSSGSLDDQILQVGVTLLDNPERRLFRHRSRLLTMRRQVLEKARARAAADLPQLRLFDAVDELYVKDWRERYANRKSGGPGGPAGGSWNSVSREKAAAHLASELKFAKTLMPLGALAGGVTRACAALLEDGPRVTKADTARGFALTQSCDRGYTVDPLVLIAPFKGRGIYEFDRDSLVVGLVPVESAEDSVANAAGNYRMLIDSLQSGGVLRKAYAEDFPGANFQAAFQADYRKWVTRVGRGEAEALEPAQRAFFRKWIGPEVDGVLAPANLRNLGPQLRETFRKQLQKQFDMAEPDANLARRLAVLCWQGGEYEEALTKMALAAKLDPHNGEVLFSLGLLMRAKGEAERARALFEACARRTPETIWGVYAADAAAGGLDGGKG